MKDHTYFRRFLALLAAVNLTFGLMPPLPVTAAPETPAAQTEEQAPSGEATQVQPEKATEAAAPTPPTEAEEPAETTPPAETTAPAESDAPEETTVPETTEVPETNEVPETTEAPEEDDTLAGPEILEEEMYSEGLALEQWSASSANVTVSGSAPSADTPLQVTTSTRRETYSGTKAIVFGYQIFAEGAASVTITVSDCGIMEGDDSFEIWKVQEGSCIQLESEITVKEGTVTFTDTSLGEYIAVSDVASFDLSQAAVTVTEAEIQGTQQDGSAYTVPFSNASGLTYRITQSTQERIQNSINFDTGAPYPECRTIILDDLHSEGSILIPAKEKTVQLQLLLRGVNEFRRIYYGTGGNEFSTANRSSTLTIDSYSGDDTVDSLYIPYKMDREDALAYVSTKASDLGPYWSQAGIGGGRDGECKACTGLTLAGGTIVVLVQNQNGATAIGGGGNADAQITITGGNITAICSSTGSAIGGGIGWVNRGGAADISITGGTVYAENVGEYTRNNRSYGGVAIGSGSSADATGSKAKIQITGGTVRAFARYGNGIGSGNSYEKAAAAADITIGGDGTVTTNALGGGTSRSAQGGDATITIQGDAKVTCVPYSDVADKLDPESENILHAYGIGGGSSAGEYAGGFAAVNVSGGTLNCNEGNIGGGSAKAGPGGDASIYITGGTLTCASIGGGNSDTGTPGAVTSTTQAAGIVVTHGTLIANTIGGGTNQAGAIGFATASISGGNIQGRFLLSNTDTSKQCTFTMTGGTIDNSLMDPQSQLLGGAVYLSDPNGSVTLSGGSIEHCTATQGGAVYMTAGTFTLDGGSIVDCQADQGGAVYLENGTVEVKDGSLGAMDHSNTAARGGGVYIQAGSLTVNGGQIAYNSATEHGAGAYLENGTMEISGGTVNHNTAATNGGGAYLADGKLTVSGGSVTGNGAQQGGGAYLGGGSLEVSGGQVSGNTAQQGAGVYLTGGNLTLDGTGSIQSNIAAQNGGGAYLSGGNLTLRSGSLDRNQAKEGGGAYVADGKVRMFGGGISGNSATTGSGGGLYVATSQAAADVVIHSGSISGNSAAQNGGGIAVSGTQGQTDTITIGVLETHPDLDLDTRDFTAFTYSFEAADHSHSSCPHITGNTAGENGGGIYIGSSTSRLTIYCLLEEANTATGAPRGNGIMTEGGTIQIGDEANTGTENTIRGNIQIRSDMLVSGGKVDIFGNMRNPDFGSNILVNIQKETDSFTDHRKQASDTGGTETPVEYKVHYFENFAEEEGQTPSGTYEVRQYSAAETITVLGNMFTHPGWTIQGWTDKAGSSTVEYTTGSVLGSEEDHTKWTDTDTALVLYAIWRRNGYTVRFEPDPPQGSAYTGTMADQTFAYGVSQKLTQNAYRIPGYRFSGWKTAAGTTYSDAQTVTSLTDRDGATVSLSAQWTVCPHSGEGVHLTYTADQDSKTITMACDCGFTAWVRLSAAAQVWHDGKAHPATVEPQDTTLSYTLTYQKTADDGSYSDQAEAPADTGKYKATLTLGDQSVWVEYEIVSPKDGTQTNALLAPGEVFTDVADQASVTVPTNGSFTLQFQVTGLTEPYAGVVPQLSGFPQGTTLILKTGGSYYHYTWGTEKEASLTAFTAMGSDKNFAYAPTDLAAIQTYQVVAKLPGGDLGDKLTIQLSYSRDTDPIQVFRSIQLASPGSFSLTAAGQALTVSAPEASAGSPWTGRHLVLVLTASKLPGDARLTLRQGDTTTEVRPTISGDHGFFRIPLAWADSSRLELSLSSATAGSYAFTALLYAAAGTDPTGTAALGSAQATEGQVMLTVSQASQPSLKLSGSTRILAQKGTLSLDVATEATDGCSFQAVIQKKEANGQYSGDFGRQDDFADAIRITLADNATPGSYRLLATVSQGGTTVLEVPYYFLVQ